MSKNVDQQVSILRSLVGLAGEGQVFLTNSTHVTVVSLMNILAYLGKRLNFKIEKPGQIYLNYY